MLLREAWFDAKQSSRRKSKAVDSEFWLENCRVLISAPGAYEIGFQDVLVANGFIQTIRPASHTPAGSEVRRIDCAGRVLMPGLCDAHVHCTAVEADLRSYRDLSESNIALRSAKILEDMLLRGFTTVRDAGGADWGLAASIEEGTLCGPRLLFSGHALSQTGGHGDFRRRGEDSCCGCAAAAGIRSLGRVCDGDAAVRQAARDELRKGAHCIKIMASGGVASPTDSVGHPQFSLQEIKAIVEEAEAVETYVAAHAYWPASIRRAVECGVRSIEHGNYLDAATAALMKEKKAFLVPTLITYKMLAEHGIAANMAPDKIALMDGIISNGLDAIVEARTAGLLPVMCSSCGSGWD
eukprot:jgi/Botrbrau1/3299/Bobra.174_1s0061.2